RDLYPVPGTRIKQWVVDMRKEDEWVAATCPAVAWPEHLDNTGLPCSSLLLASWIERFSHNCCSTCGDVAAQVENDPMIAAWRAEKAARPGPTKDRDALSDEIAPDIQL